MSMMKKRNVSIRLTDEEIEMFDRLRAAKGQRYGFHISRSQLLLECLEHGYMAVLNALSGEGEKFSILTQSDNSKIAAPITAI